MSKVLIQIKNSKSISNWVDVVNEVANLFASEWESLQVSHSLVIELSFIINQGLLVYGCYLLEAFD